ncbi:pyridoxamine 5'-phosphate oxidase family protein [Candidatus Bipolaricaulota bacterium]|nr:pyridoxamine 5'-phosphate oxidase family protein [Candidatus Bipolaricaulota bacterium]
MQSQEEIRQEVWGHLKNSQCAYLGTAEDVQPRVRPVTLLNVDEKFWIATGTRSQKARQIRRNPNVEVCIPLGEETCNGYIRVAGMASAVYDDALRRRIGDTFGYFGGTWSGPEDPDYTLIRIHRVEIEYLCPGSNEAHTFIVHTA